MAPESTLEDRVTFLVESDGTLLMEDFFEQEINSRADAFEGVADDWAKSKTKKGLIKAMSDCQPLQWEVENLAEGHDGCDNLDLEKWVRKISDAEFISSIVPAIDAWFADKPSWGDDDDYFSAPLTKYDAAFDFCDGLPREDRKALGIEVIDGEHPGSSYRGAVLRKTVEEANEAARIWGIGVRFRLLKKSP